MYHIEFKRGRAWRGGLNVGIISTQRKLGVSLCLPRAYNFRELIKFRVHSSLLTCSLIGPAYYGSHNNYLLVLEIYICIQQNSTVSPQISYYSETCYLNIYTLMRAKTLCYHVELHKQNIFGQKIHYSENLALTQNKSFKFYFGEKIDQCSFGQFLKQMAHLLLYCI